MKDRDLMAAALREAGKIIGEYLEPGPRNAEDTVNRLIAVLDTQELAGALERAEKPDGDVVQASEPGPQGSFAVPL